MVESGREKVAGQSYLSILFQRFIHLFERAAAAKREKGMEGERD